MKRIGTQRELTGEERAHLIAELKYWQTRSDDFFGVREKEERAFLNLWKGANPSGVREDRDEELAWPFNGASDQRVRWGDTGFQKLLSIIVVALDQCQVEVTCDGTAAGEKRANAIRRVMKWCRQKLGKSWYVQVQALLRYMMVDTPAVAAMDVGWKVKRTMGVSELNLERLVPEYQVWRVNSDPNVAPEDAAREFELAAAAAAGMIEEEEIGVIGTGAVAGAPQEIAGAPQEAAATVGGAPVEFLVAVKGVRAKDAEKVLAALGEDGEVECLTTATKWEGPEMKALRFGDDFMIPANTEDFDYADPLIRQEWISETQLREIAAADGWDADWVEETLKHKGGNFYDTRRYERVEDFKDSVNICWFYTAETNEDGETTRFVTVLSLADGSAFGKRVLGSRRGKWETVFFQREVLANNCLASRGLAHLCAPDQGLAKEIKDMANNNAIVSSLPAVKAKGARVRNVVLEPFAVINMSTGDDVAFMQPPAYPAAAKEQTAEIYKDMMSFLGISTPEVDESTRTQAFTSWMLGQFAELYKRLIEAAQDYASDEALLTVTGGADVGGLRHEDLDGDFQLVLQFNPANMNHKDLIDRVTALGQVIAPMDVRNEIDRGPVVRNAFAQLFPEIAEASFKTAEAMQMDDIQDEQQNFVKIKAGIMPQMDTEGKWNYQARLAWYQQLQAENPNAIAEMSQASQEIFAKWVQAMEQQAQQFGANAQIGRTGVEGVSEEA